MSWGASERTQAVHPRPNGIRSGSHVWMPWALPEHPGRLKVDNTTQPPTGMLPSQGRQLPVDNSEEVKCRRMALAVRGSDDSRLQCLVSCAVTCSAMSPQRLDPDGIHFLRLFAAKHRARRCLRIKHLCRLPCSVLHDSDVPVHDSDVPVHNSDVPVHDDE